MNKIYFCLLLSVLECLHNYKTITIVFVAPRLRATGLPCIASPETLSSGNTQQLRTENNRFIDASGS